MRVRPRRILHLLAAMALLTASIASFAGDDFPGGKLDSRILKTQEKVDSLFEKGDYERAYFIYREELAPLGDKYAQYMVGYMHITGKGVERDYLTGLSWYRLAAERGDKNFSKARDEIWTRLNEEQRQQSNRNYARTRLQFSDAMIVANLIEEDMALIGKPATGSSLTLSAEENAPISAEQDRVADQARKRIKDRRKYLRAVLRSTSELSVAEFDRIEELLKRTDKLLD